MVTHSFFGNSKDGIHSNTNSPAVKNTIVSGNTPNDCNWSVTSSGYTLESGTSCNCNEPADQQNTDPLLGSLADNGGPTLTHALLPGSPSLDAIPWPHNDAPPTDRRGFPRPYLAGRLADIGAVEMQQAYAHGDVAADDALILSEYVLGMRTTLPQEAAIRRHRRPDMLSRSSCSSPSR